MARKDLGFEGLLLDTCGDWAKGMRVLIWREAIILSLLEESLNRRQQLTLDVRYGLSCHALPVSQIAALFGGITGQAVRSELKKSIEKLQRPFRLRFLKILLLNKDLVEKCFSTDLGDRPFTSMVRQIRVVLEIDRPLSREMLKRPFDEFFALSSPTVNVLRSRTMLKSLGDLLTQTPYKLQKLRGWGSTENKLEELSRAIQSLELGLRLGMTRLYLDAIIQGAPLAHPVLDLPVWKLPLQEEGLREFRDQSLFRAFQQGRLTTVREVVSRNRKDVLKLREVGQTNLQRFEVWLAQEDLWIGMSPQQIRDYESKA